jgi:hypothetical protein
MQLSYQMKDFDQAIAPYVREIIQVPGGIQVRHRNYRVHNIRMSTRRVDPAAAPLPPGCHKRNPTPGQQIQIMTPRGIFPSIILTADAYQRSAAWVYYHVTHDTPENLYYYQP